MTKEEREVMRMALVALTIFREWELGQDYNSNRDTVLVRAFKAEEAIEKCLANDSLEKKAENARELGLDYEPAQRKPLSDEEIILIVAECASSHQHTDIHFARAIEAAIWEKNK